MDRACPRPARARARAARASRAGSSSTARWGSAGTRGRCSRRGVAGDRPRPGPVGARAGGGERSRRSATESSWCTPTTASSTACWTPGASRGRRALADLGVSSLQLDAPGRGFSFRRDEPLDMRMDTSAGVTAAEAIARADERTLADVIYRFGEERYARRVARAIVAARARGGIDTTGELADARQAGHPAQRLVSASIRRRGRFRPSVSGSTASSTGSTRSRGGRGPAERRAAGSS